MVVEAKARKGVVLVVPLEPMVAEQGWEANHVLKVVLLSSGGALHAIAADRGQSLAQMALAWALRDDRVTSLVLGASSVAQLEQNLGALDNLTFTDDELAQIDQHAVDSGIDLWAPFRLGATT